MMNPLSHYNGRRGGAQETIGLWERSSPEIKRSRCGVICSYSLKMLNQLVTWSWLVCPLELGKIILHWDMSVYNSDSKPKSCNPFGSWRTTSQGSHIGSPSDQLVILQFEIVAKLHSWSSNEINFVTGGQTTRGTVLKGHIIRNAKKHCSRQKV